MKLALYKGKGSIYDNLIRFWTKSIYSHCEILIGDKLYSSSPRDGGVRILDIAEIDISHWDFIDIKSNEEYALKVFNKYKNSKYDWMGIIFSQIIPFNMHISNRVFCSELCAEMLGYNNPESYSPHALFEIIKRHNSH